jgi:hypothetical protein
MTSTPEKAKPAGATDGHREIQITAWKPYKKNTLQAFFSARCRREAICPIHRVQGSRCGRSISGSDTRCSRRVFAEDHMRSA